MQRIKAKIKTRNSGVAFCTPEIYENIIASGSYGKLSKNPEITSAVNHIADQISVMTIKLMSNTADGNTRIRNELSRKIDINPCKYITRQAWLKKIVKDILIDGNSFHLPHYLGSALEDIQPLKSGLCVINNYDYGYDVSYNGVKFFDNELLHFTYNEDPDCPWYGRGLRMTLNVLAQRMAQARKTATVLMENPLPSIIVKVDGLTEEFSSVKGRQTLGKQFLDSSEAGRPWFIPAEAFEVEQVKPHNLNDLAISDQIKLDKRTAAAIIGVPPFLVGEGDFDKEEYNNFVSTKILPIVRGIEQELTRKILLSPKWFFEFNPRSLYSYSITELAEVDCNLVDRAIIDRNEARTGLGYDPREGLSELAILENYIPYSKIGDQNKLKGGDKENADAN